MTTAATALAESSVAREQFHALSLLLGADPAIDRGPTGALPWGVLDPETGDVLGAGESVAEALTEALATARGWTR
jgi:hypothetical protein